MAFVRVEQRNAHLAGTVRLDWVNGRDGKVARANFSAISNTYRGSGEQREEEATAIQWTAWGRQAENAAAFLGKGIRIKHQGNVQGEVIEGAFRVLDDFRVVDESTEAMKAIELKPEEERAFARAALALRYGEREEGQPPAPISAEQLIQVRRPEDQGHAVWVCYQRIQEHLTRGGLPGRTVQGRRMRTREVAGMAPSSRDRISVDLHSLKAVHFEQARARGVSPSGLVREALIDALGQSDSSGLDRTIRSAIVPTAGRVRLSLRMTREEAFAILAAARHAGMAPGAFVAGLVAGVPALANGTSRTDHLAALIASSAELSTLSRNIHHLTTLLRQGNVRPALVYREMLDTLAGDVRRHLTLAASVLADMRPRRRSA